MKLFKSKSLYIAKSPKHGWGLFTDSNISKDELIEECNIIKISDNLTTSSISTHLFEEVIGDNHIYYLPVGFCPTINSSGYANVRFEFDTTNEICKMYASRDIKSGEEILMCYGFL